MPAAAFADAGIRVLPTTDAGRVRGSSMSDEGRGSPPRKGERHPALFGQGCYRLDGERSVPPRISFLGLWSWTFGQGSPCLCFVKPN